MPNILKFEIWQCLGKWLRCARRSNIRGIRRSRFTQDFRFEVNASRGFMQNWCESEYQKRRLKKRSRQISGAEINCHWISNWRFQKGSSDCSFWFWDSLFEIVNWFRIAGGVLRQWYEYQTLELRYYNYIGSEMEEQQYTSRPKTFKASTLLNYEKVFRGGGVKERDESGCRGRDVENAEMQ